MPTEQEKAYFAGLFDGEGCVTSHACDNKKNVSISIRVMTTNTVIEPLLLGQRIWGGHVTSNGKNRRCFVWEFKSRIASRFLSDIYPYTIIKKKRIELALELQATMTNSGGKKIPTWLIEKRRELSLAIKALNAHTGFGAVKGK